MGVESGAGNFSWEVGNYDIDIDVICLEKYVV